MMNRGFDKPNNRMLDQSGNKEVDRFSRGVDQNFLMGDESLQREGFDRFCRRGNGRFLVSMAEGFNKHRGRFSGKFFPLFCHLLIFFKVSFFENSFSYTVTVSNSLDLDQARGNNLCPNCLQESGQNFFIS